MVQRLAGSITGLSVWSLYVLSVGSLQVLPTTDQKLGLEDMAIVVFL